MISLVKRNVKLYFRDREGVFFSLLSVIILILLYAFFLGENLERSVADLPEGKLLINSWLFSGVVTVSAVTTTLAGYAVMVDDRQSKRIKDLVVMPIKRGSIAGGYIFGAFIVGSVMSFITFFASQIALKLMGGELLPVLDTLKVMGYILLAVLFAASSLFFVCSLVKTSSAFGTVSTLIGTLIGFLTGLYLPVGFLPEAVQYMVKFFPPSHAGLLIRSITMKDYMAKTFENVPADYLNKFQLELGIVYEIGGKEVTALQSCLFLLLSSAVFFVISVIISKRKEK